MSSGNVQITIPDFDDGGVSSTPIPFGRSGAHGLGPFAGAGLSSGQESPTSITPLALPERAERSYFHSRGDSYTSDDSSHSIQSKFTTGRPAFFGHSTQSSVATSASNSPFTKKPSFASIRNAFRSANKTQEAPPVPKLDQEAYPVLKNPFNRSTSSLAQSPVLASRKGSVAASPPIARAPTPTSGDGKPPRTPRSRNHSYSKSYSGSIFQSSENGSDSGHGFPFSSSPPPVPPMPDEYGPNMQRSDSPLSMDLDDVIVVDPKTPSEYALHAVFMRFATVAEVKIDEFLKEELDHDPLLAECMGPGVDPKFDDLLQSLGKIAQRHAKAVVNSVMRWRKSHNEHVKPDFSKWQNGRTGFSNEDSTATLNERKSLASIYIMCRALIAILQSVSRDALGETTGYNLEESTFEQIRKPDLKLLAQSANHRANAELYAALLGQIAGLRFVSVTDHFLAELSPVASGQVLKDLDMKYENLVKALKHIHIKVWPPEAFEEGAEFMESLSKSFSNAHGFRFKTAFAEALVHLLHPIGKTAQAEVNHPQWGKAIEAIYPRAKEMISKPRYWSIAYPLLITSLCVSPHQFFLRNWQSCFEAGLSKLKEKTYRVPVMNGFLRLIWTYLYRCQESASTATGKLETLLRRFFPTTRTAIFPSEEPLEFFSCIVHLILSRHFEYGKEFCMELMQESSIKSGIPAGALSPERTAVAMQAILFSVHCIEREELTPAWPSSPDFYAIPSWQDYPSSSDILPSILQSKPHWQELVDRCGAVLAAVAESSLKPVIHMSIYDEQWSSSRVLASHDESHTYVIRRHAEGSIAYPSHLAGHISLLQTCFQSWPRCLHHAIPHEEAIDMLVRGIVHVEPSIRDVAASCLRRFTKSPQYASSVISRFSTFLFAPSHLGHDGSGLKLSLESTRVLNLYVSLVDEWCKGFFQQQDDSLMNDHASTVLEKSVEVEAGALFLLSCDARPLRSSGVKIMRMLGPVFKHISIAEGPRHVVDLLTGDEVEKSYLTGFDELLDQAELDRLKQWRQSTRGDIPLRLADSINEKDRVLWRLVFPALLRSCVEDNFPAFAFFRESVVAAGSRYHPHMAQLAGLSIRLHSSQNRGVQTNDREGSQSVTENKNSIDQWHFWVHILCSTASLPESRPSLTSVGRDHSRAPSEPGFERERMTTTRGLFRYLTPFLDSEYTIFRNAAVLCISSLPASAYPQLLEDLGLLAARQFYDETRTKPGLSISADRMRRQERLHAAVARIYYLTADFLQYQRSAGRQAALTHVLKFVRSTQAFLTNPQMRDNHTLQRLRRYFCGTVERLVDGLTVLKDSDRFIPSHMHLSLFRICDEWCQTGNQPEHVKQRLILMQRAAASGSPNLQGKDPAERFQYETRLLSNAAVGALSALCPKAFYPPDISSNSPTDRPSTAEYQKSLEVSPTLDRLCAILASKHLDHQMKGRKALKSLLIHPGYHPGLLDEALYRAFVTSDTTESADYRFFEVVSAVICDETHGFSFSQILCLGLSNLCHPLSEVRRCAFNILESIHMQSSGILPMAHFEASVSSMAPSTYVHAHLLISDFLAGEHPHQAAKILSQVATWLPRISDGRVSLLLLQSLECWISNIDLMADDMSGLSRDGSSSLYHLISITLHYGPTNAEQVLALWSRLVEPRQSNGHAAVRFLMEQSQKVGSVPFVDCAANVVACLSQTAVGRVMFADLCGIIEPARILPTIDHKLAFPDEEDMELWSDLDALFAEQPRLSLGAAQYALLFLSNVTLERQWEMRDQLPLLLHAAFLHLDHRSSYVRKQAQRMLFQLMRSWSSGYDDLQNRSDFPDRSTRKRIILHLEAEISTMLWKEDDGASVSEPRMKSLSERLLNFLGPLCPYLAEEWGTLALWWATSCSIRPIAFRCLQIHRAILPPLTKHHLGLLLGRLSNTISGPNDHHTQSFSADIISTLTATMMMGQLDGDLFPQIFWSAHASLSATVENEFKKALAFLQSVLGRADLTDERMVETLLVNQPEGWDDSMSLQSLLLTGLRSSSTCGDTFTILQTLAKIQDSRLIDSSDGRVRDLYTISLPWLLEAMSKDSKEPSLQEFASDIGYLAQQEGRDSITRIMESFVKGRFRTKDDFLRQSVSSLREHYGSRYWPEVVALLLGLLLNNERWLRLQTMQVLKVLFQQKETRDPLCLLGSELLMPLLRLLETDLASHALEVLDEPMTISGGLPAKHVLRMSMHMKTNLSNGNTSAPDVFGIPEDSGWCVINADKVRQLCRQNLTAVFDTCMMPTRPSRIQFEPDLELVSDGLEDLGGLVQNLHELTTYFQQGPSDSDNAPLIPSQQLEARVAAILMKSTNEAITDIPETPAYTDVFKVGANGVQTFDDSDSGGSDTESEPDAFIFDSPALYRPAFTSPNVH